MDAMQQTRLEAAATANAEDASVWRWLSALIEERRIRWRYMFDSWVVNVDRAHVATEQTFYDAIRTAKSAAELQGLGLPDDQRGKGQRRHSVKGSRCVGDPLISRH